MDAREISAGIVAALLTYALHSSVWILLAWGIARACKGLTRASRECLWKLAVCGGLLSTGIQHAVGWQPVLGTLRLPSRTGQPQVANVPASRTAPDSAETAPATVQPNASYSSGPAATPIPAAPIVGVPDYVSEYLALRASFERLAQQGELQHVAVLTIDEQPNSAVAKIGASDSLHQDLAAVLGREQRPVSQMTSSGAFVQPPAGRSLVNRVLLGLVCLWGAGVLVALSSMGLSWWRLLRQLRARSPLTQGPSREEFQELLQQWQARGTVLQHVRVWLVPDLAVPIGFWWGAPHIYLPERVALELDPAERRALMAHELAHVARHDAQWLLCLGLLECVTFFQVGNRFARRELAHLFELGSDELASHITGDRLALASCLARVAAWITPWRSAAPALGMVGAAEHCRSRLGQRLECLLEDGDPVALARAPAGRWAVGLASLVMLGASVPRVDATNAPRVDATAAATEQARLLARHPAHEASPTLSAALQGSTHSQPRQPFSFFARSLSAITKGALHPLLDLSGGPAPIPVPAAVNPALSALSTPFAESDPAIAWAELLLELDGSLDELTAELTQLEDEIRALVPESCALESLDAIQGRVQALVTRRQHLGRLLEHSHAPLTNPAPRSESVRELTSFSNSNP